MVRLPEGNRGGSGTAVYSDDQLTYVLTCKHVTGADRRVQVWVYDPDGRENAATLVATDDREDLALLIVRRDSGIPVCPAGSNPPRAGDRVHQAGYPNGQHHLRPQSGTVREPGRRLVLNLQVQPGDSGSGVFDAYGLLVGVVHSRDLRHPIALATGTEPVNEFLTVACLRNRQPPPPIVPPTQPPPDSRIDGVIRDVDSVKERVERVREKAEKVEEAIQRAREILEALKQRHGDSEGRIGRVEKALEIVHAIAGRLAGVETAAGTAGGWAAWLPWIAAGSASGGVLPLALLALSGLRWLKTRRVPGGPSAHPDLGHLLPAILGKLRELESRGHAQPAAPVPVPPVVVQTPGPVVQGPVQLDTQFTPVAVSDDWGKQLEKAFSYLGQRNPGLVEAFEAAKGAARQFQAGQLKQ